MKMQKISRFRIGSYTYFSDQNVFYYLTRTGRPDKEDRVKIYDRVLCQSLDKLFRDRFLTSSSDQIKNFLGALENAADQNFIIKLQILEEESVLGKHFSKEELGKLPLLWILVLAGYWDSAELLVRSGADVNELFGRHHPQVIDEKSTVLHVLLQMDSSSESERLIRLAVDHGADLQARDSKGQTALHFAVREDRVQMIEMLLVKGADVNITDDDGETPVLAAAKGDNADELVTLLVKRGADVFAKDSYGQNILHYLPQAREVKQATDLARVLIEKGVSLDDRDHSNHQFQPLHQAIIWENNELVKLYLDHGANVNARAVNGHFPLYLAASYARKPAILKTLLEHGADVRQRTTLEGRTALHVACEHHKDEHIRLLLSAGADMLAESHNGRTLFTFIKHRTPASCLMVRQLALIKVCQPGFVLKDEMMIEWYPRLQDYYRDSIEEIERTKSRRFSESCTVFELLAKCQCQFVALIRNPEFEREFRNYDLTEFSMCAEDIVRAFERAKNHYQSMLEKKDLINEAVYGILPHMVVRKIVGYIFSDCCKKKKFY